MYTIYSDTLGQHVCLHDDTVTNTAVKVIEPILTLEDNAAGSLEFKLAPNNIGYETREYTTTEMVTIALDGNYKGEVNTVTDLANVEDPQEGDIWGIRDDSSKRKRISNEWQPVEETIETREVTRVFDLVGRMSSTITVYKDGEEVWEGRVLSEDQDFFNCRKIYCEGELSYLNDTCQPAMDYFNKTLREFLLSVMDYHNRKVDASKQFKIGIVTVRQSDAETEADDYNKYRHTQYEKTMETINNLVEELGGHLRIRKQDGIRYLDYLSEDTYARTSTQTIRFGKNLLDFTRQFDMSSLCTAVLPTGAIIKSENENSKVGEELTLYHYPAPSGDMTEGQSTGYILNQDNNSSGVYWTYNEACAGYHTARAVVEPGKTYYVSCRLHGGYVMYCLRSNIDGTGDYHSQGIKKASTNIGFTDCVETKITIPEGFQSIILCGFGDAIPLRVNAEVETSSDEPQSELDAYMVLDTYKDTEYHQEGSLYVVNQEAVSQYGWIEQRLDLSDVEDQEVLYRSAVAYLTSGQFDEMTIELTAVDMNLLGVQSDKIWIQDRVRVISEPHGLDRWFPVSKLEIPLDHPADMKFSLGSTTEQTLTSVNNDIKDDLLSKLAGLPSYTKTLDSAKENAAQLIGAATGGYITLVPNQEGTGTAELVISDTPDLTQATNVWVWNVNGLCHANHYPVSQAEINAAITMEGEIVADYITTGTIRAIDIYGCKIMVGGSGDTDGYIRVIPKGLSSGSGPYIEINNGKIIGGRVEANPNDDELTWVQQTELIPNFRLDSATPGEAPKFGLCIKSEDLLMIQTRDMGIGMFDNSHDVHIGSAANTYGFVNNPTQFASLCFMDQNGNISGHRCAIVNGMIVAMDPNAWYNNGPPTWGY